MSDHHDHDLDTASDEDLKAEAFRLILDANQRLTAALQIVFALSQPNVAQVDERQEPAASTDEEDPEAELKEFNFLGGSER